MEEEVGANGQNQNESIKDGEAQKFQNEGEEDVVAGEEDDMKVSVILEKNAKTKVAPIVRIYRSWGTLV